MEKTPGKAPALKHWIRDRVVFLAVAIFVIGASVYIAADMLFDHTSIWLHPVKEFSLLISMIGVVSLGYELFLRELTFNEYKEALQEIVNPDAVRLGVRGIYKNRSELGSAFTFEKLFKDVKKEIFIGGSSLLSISTGSRDLLREKVLSGINVKMLIMDPDSEVVELITRQIGGKATFLNEIKTSLLLFQKLQEEVEEQKNSDAGELQIHTYRAIPSHSFISLDQDDPNGMIISDIGPYLGKSHQRPTMVLTPKRGGLFHHYRDLNNKLWQDSNQLQPQDELLPRTKTRTMVLVSGTSTEYLDKANDTWYPASVCQMSPQWQSIKGAQWVWVRDQMSQEEVQTGARHRFRAQFDLPEGIVKSLTRAELLLRADQTCRVTVNSTSMNDEYSGATYPDPYIIDISKYLVNGPNLIQFELITFANPNSNSESQDDARTGLIYRLHIEHRD